MADWLTYANKNAIRNDPLSARLVEALSFLPELGVTAQVFSGGQENNTTNGTGSTRHNHGNAGDFVFFKDGRKLDWANPKDLPIFMEIVRRGRAAGITGIGAGPGYMQQGSMHLGFGDPAVWGDNGKTANAPSWLRAAYEGGPGARGFTVQPAADKPYSAGPGRGSMAGYRTPGTYSGGQYVPGVEKTFYSDDSPALPGNQGSGAGASIGGFAGGPSQVAARSAGSVVPAGASGDMRPTNFQQMMARQALEGDQSQRERLLKATGLDPTGKQRLTPREASTGILGGLQNQTGAKLDAAIAQLPATMQQKLHNGILGKLFNLFG